jgi:hypothetical protein
MLSKFKATAKKNGGISVTNQRGELVCYVMLEKAFVASGTTPEEAQQAGDAADLAIECAARNAGATSVVLVLSPEHPHFPEERWVRIIERPIPQTVRMPEVGSKTSAQATHYLN